MGDRRRAATTFLGAVFRPAPKLAVTAYAAGLVTGGAEATALALLVQSAIVVADGSQGAVLELGPVSLTLSLGSTLSWAAVATVVRLGAAALLAVVAARLSSIVVDGLRQRLITAFLEAPWPVQAAEVEGELQELLVGHLARVDQAAAVVTTGLGSAGTFLALTTAAIVLAPGQAIILLVGLGLVVAVTLPGLQRVAMSSGAQAAADLGVASAGAEVAKLACEVHVYGVAREAEQRVNDRVAAAAHAQERRLRSRQLLPAVSYAVVTGTAIVALALSGAVDGLDLAATGGAVLMVIRALIATQPLQESWSQAREAAPFLAAVNKRLEHYERPAPEEHGGRRLDTIERIDLHQVGYTYPNGATGLRGIDLTIRRGEMLGVAGPSGGGKSTLAQVLLRLRTADTGEFLVNGSPGGTIAEEDWSRLVAFVPQDPLIFDGTVADNIRFFRNLSAEAVADAARLADVAAAGIALDWSVGAGRGTLSGGQRQRVVVARALAGSPDLMVLDEATSALDADAEARILDTIDGLRRRLTMVVVSHRQAPLALCDRVVRLRDGSLSP